MLAHDPAHLDVYLVIHLLILFIGEIMLTNVKIARVLTGASGEWHFITI